MLRRRRSRAADATDEQRILDYVGEALAFSETAPSLATKLGIDLRIGRAVLEGLARIGRVRRQVFGDIETIYFRNPRLDERDALGQEVSGPVATGGASSGSRP